MHNLHYVMVSADSAEEACREVQDFAEDYGDENNWSSICGCVSVDNKDIHLTDDGRWSSESVFKLENIKKDLFAAIKPKEDLDVEALVETLRTLLVSPHKASIADAWTLHYQVGAARERCEALNGEFVNNAEELDLLNFELNSWNFDSFGITNASNDSDGELLYIVGLDMHS